MYQSKPSSFHFDNNLNSSFLNELFDGDYQYAETVFADFLKYLPEYSEEIEAAYRQKNIEELRKAVHKCKTLMGFVGLSTIQTSYLNLEKMCEAGQHTKEIDAAYVSLKEQTGEGKSIIIKELERLRAFNDAQK